MNMALEEIRGFLLLEDGLGTSGMPRAEHFREMAKAGYRIVINLALPTSDNALANEGELVTREGMSYVQIPVKFDAPKRDDFEQFRSVMNAFERPVFVHCAANMRVSAFLFLYRLHENMATRSQAEADLRRIWEPDEVWRRFINENLPSGELPL
jgi:protein tyrosine phosphatase (PTP) superfamily phosphohydrolase (DUF442 family)